MLKGKKKSSYYLNGDVFLYKNINISQVQIYSDLIDKEYFQV